MTVLYKETIAKVNSDNEVEWQSDTTVSVMKSGTVYIVQQDSPDLGEDYVAIPAPFIRDIIIALEKALEAQA